MAPPAALNLTHGEIQVWRAELDQAAAQVEQLAQTLSPAEHQRAARFHFQRDRRRFIVGRGILRTILGQYLGLEPDQVKFCYGPHGKPALVEPYRSGESQLFFNLAHSGELAIYAFRYEQEIGVDVEQIHPIAEMEQIAERFFAPSERTALLALPLEQRQEAFFNCWTRKEAYLKALGDGLARPLDQFCVSLMPEEPAQLLSITANIHEAAHWLLEAFNPVPGYVAAVAVYGQNWRFSFWDFPPASV